MREAMAGVSVLNQVEDFMDLPPGFRFHPTNEEIITHYLSPKVVNRDFNARAVGEVDLNKCEPWELPGKAKMGEKEWYFFCHKDRKYPTGTRTNRATKRGYWKATGKDKEIHRENGTLVGMKKTLVFYEGRAPKGTKTNWVMHEFRLHGESNLSNIHDAVKDEWVVCRVIHKSNNLKKTPQQAGMERVDDLEEHKYLFDEPERSPPLMDPSFAGPSSRPVMSLAASAGYLDNDFGFTTNPASFSNLLGTPNQQPLISNPLKGANDGVLNCPQLQPQSSYYTFQGTTNLGYLHQDHDMLRELTGAAGNNDASSAIRKHCKMDQYSNQSFGRPSQDTDLSTDHNTEISLEFSKSYFDDLDFFNHDYGSIIWED